MITYYSKAWMEACKDKMNNSDQHMKKARKLDGLWFFRLYDGPDKKDRSGKWLFDKGKVVSVEFESKPSPWTELRDAPLPADAVGRFTSPFDMMAALNRGEISPLKALSSPDYKLEGKKVLVFKMMQGINSWNDHNALVECDYDFTETDDEGNKIG